MLLLLCAICIAGATFGIQTHDKRLFLNDPDVSDLRVSHLEQQVAKIQSKYNELLSKVTFVQAFEKQTYEKRVLLNGPDVSDLRISHVEQQMTEIQTKYNDLLSKTTKLETYVLKQDQIISSLMGNGATYVRWGKTRCSGLNTELVYSGYAAGQYYAHTGATTYTGGPANNLCLPDDPQLSNMTGGLSSLLGTKYRIGFDLNDDHDVPCAVCRTTNASSAIMIPGRQSCYSGWRLEYSGFLAGGHDLQTASEYVCVDSNPEYIPSGNDMADGHRFYSVAIKCGPLRCPPYEDDRKVYCVVCSK